MTGSDCRSGEALLTSSEEFRQQKGRGEAAAPGSVGYTIHPSSRALSLATRQTGEQSMVT